MLGDLAAMLECADAIRNNAVTVWDRRQWQQQQQQPRSLDWEVGSYASSASASSASSAGIRPQPVAVRRIDKDYVGLLVWSGQNLMCGAEERGWRATEQLLDGLLQVRFAAPAPYCPPLSSFCGFTLPYLEHRHSAPSAGARDFTERPVASCGGLEGPVRRRRS